MRNIIALLLCLGTGIAVRYDGGARVYGRRRQMNRQSMYFPRTRTNMLDPQYPRMNSRHRRPSTYRGGTQPHLNIHIVHLNPRSSHGDTHTDTHLSHEDLHRFHVDSHSSPGRPHESNVHSHGSQADPHGSHTDPYGSHTGPHSSSGHSHGSHGHSHGDHYDPASGGEGFPIYDCKECPAEMECRVIGDKQKFCMPLKHSSSTSVKKNGKWKKDDGSGPSRCYEPGDKGRCNSNVHTRYYYDPNKGRCARFSWSGCGGNDNRFFRLRDCKRTCMPNKRNGRSRNRSRSSRNRSRNRSLLGRAMDWFLEGFPQRLGLANFGPVRRPDSRWNRRPSNPRRDSRPPTDNHVRSDHAHMGIHGI